MIIPDIKHINMLHLNVVETLRFFDEKPEGSHGHATAIVGMMGEDMGAALLVRHLKDLYGSAKIVSEQCTTGKKKGSRLDRWIGANINGKWTLFQVEIKNWSAHAFGGKRLSIDATNEDLRVHRIESWNNHWDGNGFRIESVQKVFKQMKPAEDSPVEPLVCFWDSIHPNGESEPLFKVNVKTEHFSKVWVFSMSTYLRGIDLPTIELYMPNTSQRLRWMKQMFDRSLIFQQA